MDKMNQLSDQNLYLSPRLKEQLKRILQYPITALEAPMGYGKTTAVKAFFSTEPVKIGWVQICDGYSCNFWRSFVNAIDKIDSDCARELLELDLPNDNLSSQLTMDVFKRMKLRFKFVLVIDDYHLIENTQVHHFITMLSRLKIVNLFLVLTCRRVPIEGFDSMVLKGEALHLHKETLEFNADDIKKFFKQSDIQLTSKEVNALLLYTEGWISALYLYKMSYLKDGKFDENQQQGGIPSIYALFENAVFALLSEEEQGLLIQLACFENFTLKQVEYILEGKSIAQLLKKLVSQNAFITYDQKTKLYQLHNILTNYLYEKFIEMQIKEQYRILSRVAKWYQKNNECILAIRYYYQAHDYEGVAQIMIEDKGQSLHPEDKGIILSFFNDCPEELKVKYPLSLLVYGLCLFTFNEMEKFQELCLVFPDYIEMNKDLSTSERNQLLGEYELLLSFTAFNRIKDMHAHHIKALQLLGGPSQYMNSKDGWTMGSPSVLYMFHRIPGDLKDTLKEMTMSMPTYYQLSRNHGAGAEYVMKAEEQFYKGNFIEAEIELHKARQMAKNNKQSEIVLCTWFLEIRCLVAQGRPKEAQEVLGQMHLEMDKCIGRNLHHTIDLIEGYIYAILGMEDKAARWIIDGNFDSERLYLAGIGYYHMVYCRLLLNYKQFTRLIGEVDYYIEASKTFPNLLTTIALTIYKAAAYEQIYRRTEALENIRLAFDLAIPDELFMDFVESASYIIHLLDILSSEEQYRWQASRIKTLYRIQTNNAPKLEVSDKNQLLAEPQQKKQMTDREHEIAVLAAIGLSNKAIAEQVFVSENTIKTTLKSVFDKLDIKSRTQLKDALTDK